MDDSRGVIFLLHGVDCRLDTRKMPDWYARVRSELQPHFDIVELRYRAYDFLGKFHVASFRGGAAVALLIGILIASRAKSAPMTIFATAAIILIGLFLTMVERYRRERTINDVAAQLGTNYRRGRKHHVIAHSFGTFLLPRALARTTVSIETVILAGAVLPRKFDWHRIWRHRPDPFRLFCRIRNEFGADWVANLAGWGWVLTGCGRAGAGGFMASTIHDAPPVHDVGTPWGPCPEAPVACASVPIIHNVALGDDYGHSGVFLSGLHAKDLWLPTFWSYEPHAYGDFATLCGDIMQRHDDGYPLQAEELCDSLLDKRFAWFGTAAAPRSIREVVTDRFAAVHVPLTPKRLIAITRFMAEFLAAGWRGEDPDARPLAFPARALAAAIDHTLNDG